MINACNQASEGKSSQNQPMFLLPQDADQFQPEKQGNFNFPFLQQAQQQQKQQFQMQSDEQNQGQGGSLTHILFNQGDEESVGANSGAQQANDKEPIVKMSLVQSIIIPGSGGSNNSSNSNNNNDQEAVQTDCIDQQANKSSKPIFIGEYAPILSASFCSQLGNGNSNSNGLGLGVGGVIEGNDLGGYNSNSNMTMERWSTSKLIQQMEQYKQELETKQVEQNALTQCVDLLREVDDRKTQYIEKLKMKLVETGINLEENPSHEDDVNISPQKMELFMQNFGNLSLAQSQEYQGQQQQQQTTPQQQCQVPKIAFSPQRKIVEESMQDEDSPASYNSIKNKLRQNNYNSSTQDLPDDLFIKQRAIDYQDFSSKEVSENAGEHRGSISAPHFQTTQLQQQIQLQNQQQQKPKRSMQEIFQQLRKDIHLQVEAQFRATLEHQRKELAAKNTELQKKNQEMLEVKRKMNELNMLIDMNQDEIQSLEIERNESRERVNQLEGVCEAKGKEAEQLQQALEVLRQKIQNYESETSGKLEEMRSQLQDSQSRQEAQKQVVDSALQQLRLIRNAYSEIVEVLQQWHNTQQELGILYYKLDSQEFAFFKQQQQVQQQQVPIIEKTGSGDDAVLDQQIQQQAMATQKQLLHQQEQQLQQQQLQVQQHLQLLLQAGESTEDNKELFLQPEVLEESLTTVKLEFKMMQKVMTRLNEDCKLAEQESGRLLKQKDLLIIEKGAVIAENNGFKGVYRTLEKELRKTVKELEELRDKNKDVEALEAKVQQLEGMQAQLAELQSQQEEFKKKGEVNLAEVQAQHNQHEQAIIELNTRIEQLEKDKNLLQIEKNAVISENQSFKSTFHTIEKELKKSIREIDDLRLLNKQLQDEKKDLLASVSCREIPASLECSASVSVTSNNSGEVQEQQTVVQLEQEGKEQNEGSNQQKQPEEDENQALRKAKSQEEQTLLALSEQVCEEVMKKEKEMETLQQQYETEIKDLRQQKDLMERQLTALVSENNSAKNTYKILEKELKKSIMERDHQSIFKKNWEELLEVLAEVQKRLMVAKKQYQTSEDNPSCIESSQPINHEGAEESNEAKDEALTAYNHNQINREELLALVDELVQSCQQLSKEKQVLENNIIVLKQQQQQPTEIDDQKKLELQQRIAPHHLQMNEKYPMIQEDEQEAITSSGQIDHHLSQSQQPEQLKHPSISVITQEKALENNTKDTATGKQTTVMSQQEEEEDACCLADLEQEIIQAQKQLALDREDLKKDQQQLLHEQLHLVKEQEELDKQKQILHQEIQNLQLERLDLQHLREDLEGKERMLASEEAELEEQQHMLEQKQFNPSKQMTSTASSAIALQLPQDEGSPQSIIQELRAKMEADRTTLEESLQQARKELELVQIEKSALDKENKSFHAQYKMMEREFKKTVKERDKLKHDLAKLQSQQENSAGSSAGKRGSGSITATTTNNNGEELNSPSAIPGSAGNKEPSSDDISGVNSCKELNLFQQQQQQPTQIASQDSQISSSSSQDSNRLHKSKNVGKAKSSDEDRRTQKEQKLIEELAKMKQQLQQFKDECLTAQEQSTKDKERADSLLTQIKVLEQQIEKQRQQAAEELVQSENKCAQLNTELQAVQQQLQEAVQIDTTPLLTQLEQQTTKLDQLLTEKKFLEVEKTALASENANYKNTFKTIEKELKKAVRERDEHKTTLTTIQEEKKAQDSRLEELVKRCAEVELKFEQLSNSSNTLSGQCVSLQQKPAPSVSEQTVQTEPWQPEQQPLNQQQNEKLLAQQEQIKELQDKLEKLEISAKNDKEQIVREFKEKERMFLNQLSIHQQQQPQQQQQDAKNNSGNKPIEQKPAETSSQQNPQQNLPENMHKLKKMKTLLMDEMNEQKRKADEAEFELKRRNEITEMLEQKYVELKKKFKVLTREHEELQEASEQQKQLFQSQEEQIKKLQVERDDLSAQKLNQQDQQIQQSQEEQIQKLKQAYEEQTAYLLQIKKAQEDDQSERLQIKQMYEEQIKQLEQKLQAAKEDNASASLTPAFAQSNTNIRISSSNNNGQYLVTRSIVQGEGHQIISSNSNIPVDTQQNLEQKLKELQQLVQSKQEEKDQLMVSHKAVLDERQEQIEQSRKALQMVTSQSNQNQQYLQEMERQNQHLQAQLQQLQQVQQEKMISREEFVYNLELQQATQLDEELQQIAHHNDQLLWQLGQNQSQKQMLQVQQVELAQQCALRQTIEELQKYLVDLESECAAARAALTDSIIEKLSLQQWLAVAETESRQQREEHAALQAFLSEKVAAIEATEAAEGAALQDLRAQVLTAKEDCLQKDQENKLLANRLRQLQLSIVELQQTLEAKEAIIMRQYSDAAATEQRLAQSLLQIQVEQLQQSESKKKALLLTNSASGSTQAHSTFINNNNNNLIPTSAAFVNNSAATASMSRPKSCTEGGSAGGVNIILHTQQQQQFTPVYQDILQEEEYNSGSRNDQFSQELPQFQDILHKTVISNKDSNQPDQQSELQAAKQHQYLAQQDQVEEDQEQQEIEPVAANNQSQLEKKTSFGPSESKTSKSQQSICSIEQQNISIQQQQSVAGLSKNNVSSYNQHLQENRGQQYQLDNQNINNSLPPDNQSQQLKQSGSVKIIQPLNVQGNQIIETPTRAVSNKVINEHYLNDQQSQNKTNQTNQTQMQPVKLQQQQLSEKQQNIPQSLQQQQHLQAPQQQQSINTTSNSLGNSSQKKKRKVPSSINASASSFLQDQQPLQQQNPNPNNLNCIDQVYQQCLQRSQTLLNKNQMILHQINKNSNIINNSLLLGNNSGGGAMQGSGAGNQSKQSAAKSLYTPNQQQLPTLSGTPAFNSSSGFTTGSRSHNQSLNSSPNSTSMTIAKKTAQKNNDINQIENIFYNQQQPMQQQSSGTSNAAQQPKQLQQQQLQHVQSSKALLSVTSPVNEQGSQQQFTSTNANNRNFNSAQSSPQSKINNVSVKQLQIPQQFTNTQQQQQGSQNKQQHQAQVGISNAPPKQQMGALNQKQQQQQRYQQMQPQLQQQQQQQNKIQQQPQNIQCIKRTTPSKSQTNISAQIPQGQFQQLAIQPRYEGERLNNMRHGKGRHTYANGETYEGEWLNDKRHGYGIQKDITEKEIYAGDWEKDQYNGTGRLHNKHPQVMQKPFSYQTFNELGNYWLSYQGEFQGNCLHGVGTLSLANGEKFIGSFREGRVHGEGTFYTKTGQVVIGQWEANNFVGKI